MNPCPAPDSEFGEELREEMCQLLYGDLLTLDQVCSVLGVTRQVLTKRIQAEDLALVQLGKVRYMSRAVLAGYIKRSLRPDLQSVDEDKQPFGGEQ